MNLILYKYQLNIKIMGIIKDTIPTLKRRNRVSEELKKVIRNLKKYQKPKAPNRRIFGNYFVDDLFDYGLFNDVVST